MTDRTDSDRQTDEILNPRSAKAHAKNIRYLRQRHDPAPRDATERISAWPGGV